MKKQVLYLLAALCVAWFMPNVALAYDVEIDGIYYNFSITSIGGRAFEGCSSLTYIDISNSVTNIGDYAFSNCI